MAKLLLRAIGWISDIHDTYVWAAYAWASAATAVTIMIALIEGLPLATKITLGWITFAAALAIWFIIAWAPSKTTWGKKAKRRARLNKFLGKGADTIVRVRQTPPGKPFGEMVAAEYESWAIEVRDFLKAEYDDVAGDAWFRIGASFTVGDYGRQVHEENEKLTEMSILYKKLENRPVAEVW